MRRFQIFDVRRAHRFIVVPRLEQIQRKGYARHRISLGLLHPTYFLDSVMNIAHQQFHRIQPFSSLYFSRGSQCTRLWRRERCSTTFWCGGVFNYSASFLPPTDLAACLHGTIIDEEFFTIPSWTDHVEGLELPMRRTQRRSEAKSPSYRTNNREAESWNVEWSQKNWSVDERSNRQKVDRLFNPFRRASSFRQDPALVAQACS